MSHTLSQLEIIRQCSKDEAAYRTLVELFRNRSGASSPDARQPEASEDNDKYRQLFELESDAVFLIDNEAGQILEVNAAGAALYGYSREELLTMKNTDLSAEPDATRKAVAEQPTRVPVRYHRRKDGTMITVEIAARFFTWKGRAVHIAAIRDITERQNAEIALRESEERYRKLVEMLPMGVLIHQQEKIVFANAAALGYLGAEAPDEVIGKPSIQFVHPDQRALALHRLRTMLETSIASPSVEQTFLRCDGAPLHVEVKSIPFTYRGETAIMTVFSDIAARKASEQQAFQLALERERVHVLADFVQGASHEFRTPLSVINTRLYLLKRVATAEEREQHENIIAQQVQRLTRLLDEMLTLSRLDAEMAFRNELVNLNEMILSVKEKLNPAIEEKYHRVTLELAEPLPLVQGDQVMLYRVFANILTNAIRYTPPDGTIALRTSARDDRVIVEIEDSGIGMSDDTRARIFERFYRADKARVTPGFGLGLPIAHKIVERHQGWIEVESAAGHGSVFRVVLPVR